MSTRHTRTLGKTGIQVSELSLGGLFISSHGTNYAEAEQVIRRAFALGINYIDTAPGYANSEEVLGKVLPRIEEPYIISTKLGYQPEPYEPQNAEFLRKALERSLKFLNRDSVDILMIHEPDRPDVMDWWAEKDEYRGPVMDILQEARDSGKTRFVGIGGTTAYEMGHVIDTGNFDVLLTAFQYDLLWREAEHMVLPNAAKHDMGVVIGSPLHQGALARQYVNDVTRPAKWLSPPRAKQLRKLYALANDLRMPLPELAIRFVLSNPQVSTVLTGVRSVKELEQNVACVERGPLPENVLGDLKEIADLVPFRPEGEPLGLPFES